MNNEATPQLESHPFEPFIPSNARVLIMGTFPPQQHRWSMPFYYPNPINDFWRVMGLIFGSDASMLLNDDGRTFNLPRIIDLCERQGIALNDTGREVRRLRDNASDKFLEIVTPVPLNDLLKQMPLCQALATTGQKAAEVLASITDTVVPAMGQSVPWTAPDGRQMAIWRLPSTSRAYPMRLGDKAEYYQRLFDSLSSNS